MLIEKKYFGGPQGSGNFDDAFFAVGPNSWVNMENCRTLTTDGGQTGVVQSIGSTILIPNTSHAVNSGDIEIGSAVDETRNRVIYFMWNPSGNHYICSFDVDSNSIQTVLQDSQVTGGLNFDKDHLIHSTRVENGCVYWTDNLNIPRRINIDAGISANLVVSAPFHSAPPNVTFTLPLPPAPPQSQLILSYLHLLSTVSASVSLDWSNYPTVSFPQVVVNGIAAYFTANGISPSNYSLTIAGNSIILSLGPVFHWPNGDPVINTAIVTLQFLPSSVTPYTIPVSQSVISWARRQPGMAPGITKQFQSSPPVPVNQIDKEAFLFAFRYIYRDYETSTLSSWSYLANFNSTDQTFNRIAAFLPLNEKIDQDVIQVDLVVQYLIGEVAFVINSWRRSVAADLAAINTHNAGTTALTYLFYNDQTGIALDSAYTAKPFDSIPIKAETIEMAKNRAFMADYTIGYTTPLSSSLAYTTSNVVYTPGGSTSIVGEWFFIGYSWPPNSYSHYIIRTTIPIFTSDPSHAYYYYLWIAGTVPPFPSVVNGSDLLYMGFDGPSSMNSLISHFGETGGAFFSPIFIGLIDESKSSTINPASPIVTGFLGRAFKTYASYQLAIHFKDNYGAECGAYTNASLIVNIPDALGITPGSYTFVNAINWTLNNTNALAEIPDWAYYYSVDITKCLRTRFFQQALGTIIYAAKDPSNNYTFTTTVYSSTLAGVAIDLTTLNSYGQGYVLSVGDEVRLFVNNTFYNLAIIDQAAQYIICQLANVGSLSSVEGQFEIFTPYKRLVNEPFFEIGQVIPVLNPGTNTRAYTFLSGTISGDISLLQRQSGSITNITEAMSPNDKFYKLWFTDAGRSIIIDYIGQKTKSNDICFSNTFIPGSQDNGLSTFDALDTKPVYPECGPIHKLQLTSKVGGEQGSIMLAICEQETASLYLGESQLLAAVGNANVAISDNVIGTVNVLKGSFGTTNPESVTEFRGNVFWVNVSNGKVIQYSANGLFPISNYKATKFWKLFCSTYASLSTSQIEALGSRPFIFTCVDPHNWELLVTVPKVLATPPKGYLPDYPNMIYPFDIWDGQAKTIVFKLNADPNHWPGSYRHTPDGMFIIQNKVYGFKSGNLWVYNAVNDLSLTIFGVQYTARIMFPANQVPNRPKVYNNISLESNLKPSLTYFRTEPSLSTFDQYDLPEQASDLLDFDYEVKEGNLYAALYRNKLQPTATGLDLNGLLTGEEIRALSLLVLLEFTTAVSYGLNLRFVNLNYQISGGHST